MRLAKRQSLCQGEQMRRSASHATGRQTESPRFTPAQRLRSPVPARPWPSHPQASEAGCRSAAPVPRPRGARLRRRMDVSSDRGRGPAHPPAAEHRQDGAELLLIASSNDSQDHGPHDCATDAVARVAPWTDVHPPIIPGRQLVRSIASASVSCPGAPWVVRTTSRPTRATEPSLMHCHRQRQALGEESAESALGSPGPGRAERASRPHNAPAPEYKAIGGWC